MQSTQVLPGVFPIQYIYLTGPTVTSEPVVENNSNLVLSYTISETANPSNNYTANIIVPAGTYASANALATELNMLLSVTPVSINFSVVGSFLNIDVPNLYDVVFMDSEPLLTQLGFQIQDGIIFTGPVTESASKAPILNLYTIWSQSFSAITPKTMVGLLPSIDCTIQVSTNSGALSTLKNETTYVLPTTTILTLKSDVMISFSMIVLNTSFSIQLVPLQHPVTIPLPQTVQFSKLYHATTNDSSITIPDATYDPMTYLPYDALKPSYVHLELLGSGHTSLGTNVFGGAGASFSGLLTDIEGETIDLEVAKQPGGISTVSHLNEFIAVAAGGGQGGSPIANYVNLGNTGNTQFSSTIQVSEIPANGGSCYGTHGFDGLPAYVGATKLGTYSTLISTKGQGAPPTQGGSGGTNGSSGTFLTGGTSPGHASGGSGYFGGGSGGSATFQSLVYYGGAGSGSSYTRRLYQVNHRQPINLSTQPQAVKGSFGPDPYANGASTENISNSQKVYQVTVSDNFNNDASACVDFQNNPSLPYGPGAIYANVFYNVSTTYCQFNVVFQNMPTGYTVPHEYATGYLDLNGSYLAAALLAILNTNLGPPIEFTESLGYLTFDGTGGWSSVLVAFEPIYDTMQLTTGYDKLCRAVLNRLGFTNVQMSTPKTLKAKIYKRFNQTTITSESILFRTNRDYTVAEIVTILNTQLTDIVSYEAGDHILMKASNNYEFCFSYEEGFSTYELMELLGFIPNQYIPTLLCTYNNLVFRSVVTAAAPPTIGVSGDCKFYPVPLVAENPYYS